jgi:hypothetical protein
MTKQGNQEKTRNGYICGLYLSKFDKDAIRELGCKTLKDACITIGHILGYKHTTINNNRDRFDLFYEKRVGHKYNSIPTTIQQIFDEFNHYDFETLSKIVKDILGKESYKEYSETLITDLSPEQIKYLKEQLKKEQEKLDKERNLEEKRCVLALYKIERGKREVPIFDYKSIALVGLADLITDTEIIEVKNINNWKHAVGQIFAYWYFASKYENLMKNQLHPRIHLFGGIGISDPRIELCKSLMKEVFNHHTTSTRVTYVEKFSEYF